MVAHVSAFAPKSLQFNARLGFCLEHNIEGDGAEQALYILFSRYEFWICREQKTVVDNDDFRW